MDESDAQKYFCHQCNLAVDPIIESESEKCSICQSLLVELITPEVPHMETPFSFVSRLPDFFQFPSYTSELSRIMSPFSLTTSIHRRRLNWDDDEDVDDDERNFDYNEPDFDSFFLNDPSMYGVKPAQKEAVEALPTVKVNETMSCCVCLDECEIGCEVTEMPCKHTFHGECITPWLELHNSCPLCRHELPSAEPEIDNFELLNINSSQEDQSDSRIGGLNFYNSLARPWGLPSWMSYSSSLFDERPMWSPYLSLINSGQESQNRPLVSDGIRREGSWLLDFTSSLPDSPLFTERSTATFMNNIGQRGLNHSDIGGEEINDIERLFSRYFMDIHPPSCKRLINALWSMNGRHLPSGAYGSFSSLYQRLMYELGGCYEDKSIPRYANTRAYGAFCSLYWTRMYELGGSYNDNSIPQDRDNGLKFCNGDPSIATMQPFGYADVIGGPIHDPTSYSSPFKDDNHLVTQEAKSLHTLSSSQYSPPCAVF